MSRSNVALIGFQGCGKTTLGAKLARCLNRPFLDTDHLIESYHSGLNCSQIFRQFGESYFRQLEGQVIDQLEQQKNVVIAIGGGSLLQETNRLSLKKHSDLFYLKTPMRIVKERIWSRSQLPAYLDVADPHGSFHRLYQERAELYAQLADQVVELSFVSINLLRHYIFLLKSPQKISIFSSKAHYARGLKMGRYGI